MLSAARRRTTVLTGTATAGAVLAALTLGSPAVAGRPAEPVSLSPVGTAATGDFGASAAEIVAHDPRGDRLFVVNAESGQVDVLDAADPARPTFLSPLAVAGLAAADGSVVDADAVVNSVAVHDRLLAVAVEAGDKVGLGWVVLYDLSGEPTVRAALRVGSLPDMVSFSPNGRTLVVANEAEPADDFSSDPEGSISVITLSGRPDRLTQAAVRNARFTAFEGGALPAGVRVFGPDVPVPAGQAPAGRVARNLEPEYVTVDHDSRTAYVTLQENNTIAEVDLRTATVTRLLPLGLKDWSATTAGFDASDRDGGISLQQWPVFGLYQPDAITSYRVKGRTYLVTANEGDAREFGSYVDARRLRSDAYRLCPDVFGDAASLRENSRLGRLAVSYEDGRRADGCYEQIVALGGRSFSIWTTDGELVHDSGSELEQLIASGAGGLDPLLAFNATNSANGSFDSRSDDKGPEPEGVTVGEIAGRTYAFLGLERVGGVVTVDVTDPRSPVTVDYVNTRNFSAAAQNPDGSANPAAGDLGPEGLTFIPAEDSPTRAPLLVVASEVSGTTTTFAVRSGGV